MLRATINNYFSLLINLSIIFMIKGVRLHRDDRDKSQPKFGKERVVPTNILIYLNIYIYIYIYIT